MANLFITKLRGQGDLPSEDVGLIEAACGNARDVPAGHDLIREGDKPGPVFVVLEGWACRYKLLPEGTRQITALLMPGDCSELYASVLEAMEHSIATLTPCRIAWIDCSRVQELIATRPALMRAFWWMQLVDEDTLRAWIVSMGRRSSVQRVSHLMCELYVRARSVGLTEDGRLEVPLTQLVLADALGLTAVHVSRVLKKLRASGVMDLTGRSLTVTSIAELARVAGFDETYLHRRLRRAA